MDMPDSASDFGRVTPKRNVMEEIGYISWQFDIVDEEKDCAWKYFKDGTVYGFGSGVTVSISGITYHGEKSVYVKI